MDERPPGHRALPPGDAPDPHRADAADDADVGVRQRRAQLAAEVGVGDLGGLWDEYEGGEGELAAVGDDPARVEVNTLARAVEEEVEAAGKRARSREGQHLGIGLP